MSFDSGLVKSSAAPHYITSPTTSLRLNGHQLAVHGSDASKLFSCSLPKIAEARHVSAGQAAQQRNSSINHHASDIATVSSSAFGVEAMGRLDARTKRVSDIFLLYCKKTAQPALMPLAEITGGKYQGPEGLHTLKQAKNNKQEHMERAARLRCWLSPSAVQGAMGFGDLCRQQF